MNMLSPIFRGSFCYCLAGTVALTIAAINFPRAIAYDPAKEPTLTLDPALRSRCLDILQQGLRGKEFWPAMHAAEALTLAGRGDDVRAFLNERLPKLTDDRERCGAARELVRAGNASPLPVLFDVLAKPDPYGHVHAAESLFKIGQVGDGKLLRAAMAQTKNASLQLMAAAALQRGGDHAGLPVIRRRLAEPNPESQRIAAWLIGQLGDKSDIPQLQTNGRDERDSVKRAYAECALGLLGDDSGRQALERNLQHASEEVRALAAMHVADARLIGLVGPLEKMLDDPNTDVRIRAAEALLVLSLPVSKQAVRPNESKSGPGAP